MVRLIYGVNILMHFTFDYMRTTNVTEQTK